MYSVIIQNQNTLDSFAQYYPLFMEAFTKNRIGVCKWIESGTTIDTAVPGLGDLTNDKKEWQAIIVRYEDDAAMSAYSHVPGNPFDFLVNYSVDPAAELESQVPLIRLTHMLGGLPTPDVEFKYEQVYDGSKQIGSAYIPVRDREKECSYKKTSRKYRFDGQPPSSIIIISVRDKNYRNDPYYDDEDRSDRNQPASEFWHRNRYPSICRFMVCDFDRRGPVKKSADEFNLWLSVLLVSVNDGCLAAAQAYRLYSLKTELDRTAMKDVLQRTYTRLMIARGQVHEEITTELNDRISEGTALPQYKINAPVVIKTPPETDKSLCVKTFGFLSRGLDLDVVKWKSQRREVEDKLSESILAAERALDQTATRAREFCSFTADEVTPLNKYQEEDMVSELHNLRNRITAIQTVLPNRKHVASAGVRRIAEKVRNALVNRLTYKTLSISISVVISTVILSILPAVIFRMPDATLNKWGVTALMAVLGISVIASALAPVWIRYKDLKNSLTEYNNCIDEESDKLLHNAANYSTYLSDIISHIRGSSYMLMSDRQKDVMTLLHFSKYKHIKSINELMQKVVKWGKSHYIDIDQKSDGIDERVRINTDIPPQENPIYTFDYSMSYPMWLNNIGKVIESPFSFTERLVIVGEELDNDAEPN